MSAHSLATVLVVEDDPGIAELERGRLEDAGYRVALAATADEAADRLRQGPIDLVLLDYRLPGGVDGLDFYARARAAGLDPPVILVTGFSDEGTVIRALRAGVRDFVTKSVEYLDYLPEAVGRVLGQVQTERRLAESEARFRSLIDSMDDIVFTLDRHQRHTGVYGRWLARFGAGADYFLGKTAREILGPDAAPPHEEANRRALAGERVLYEWSFAGDGGVRWFQTSLSPLVNGGGRVAGVVGVGRDITERKRAEEALRESEARFRDLADHAPMLVWLAGPDGRCTYFNRVWLTFTGRSLDQELGDGWADGVHPDDRPRCLADYRAALAERRPFTIEYRLRRADGEYRWVIDNGVPRFTAAGEFTGYLGSGMDLTDRREAEEARRRSELLFRGVWEKSQDGMRLTDAAGVIRRVNDAYCRIVGLPRPALEGSPLTVAYTPAQGAALLADHARRFATREEGPHVTKDRVLWDGRKVQLDASYTFVEPPGEPPLLLSVVRDITGQVRLEQQFRQAQKMEVVGRLAGGVAHDFNNLLTVINGFSDLALETLPADDPVRGMIEEVRRSGERAADLTRQLLALSRQQVVEPKVLDLNALVGDAARMLRRLIGEDVELRTELTRDLRRIKADRGQVEQVVMNLAVNARDAMPTGGRLTIATRNACPGEAEWAGADARPGGYVVLRVTDTGTGMTAEVREKIFEPFFTTKEAGKGTGLGLSTVYGIVTQAGGHVGVESEPGRGTTFEVYLPATTVTDSGSRSYPALRLTRSGSETVLLAEDDESVRAFARRVLAGAGYTVLEAGDGAAAVAACERHAGPIHLFVSDVVMPGLGGRELAARVAELRPGVKVLFLSGYTPDAVLRHGVQEEAVAFLQKPFTPAALSAKVREVLDGG